MSQKRVKRLRKELNYDMKKERLEGRKHFMLSHKILKDENNNPKQLGIVCDEQRRLYRLIKKITS